MTSGELGALIFMVMPALGAWIYFKGHQHGQKVAAANIATGVALGSGSTNVPPVLPK